MPLPLADLFDVTPDEPESHFTVEPECQAVLVAWEEDDDDPFEEWTELGGES
jgi:hypothetical protein